MFGLNRMQLLQGFCGVLFCSLLLCAMSVVDLSFKSREVYNGIEAAYREQLSLETLQGQLRLEHGTWVAPAEVEQRALTEVGMIAPQQAEIVVLQN